MSVQLTQNAVHAMFSGQTVPQAVLQILAATPVSSGPPGAGLRYRLLVSDGQHKTNTLVSSEFAEQIASGSVPMLSLIQVHGSKAIQAGNKRPILFLTGFHLLQPHNQPIGNPVMLSVDAEGAGEGGDSGHPGGHAGGAGYASAPQQHQAHAGGMMQQHPPQAAHPPYGAGAGAGAPNFGAPAGGQFGGAGPVVRNTGFAAGGGATSFTPIRALSPYNARWTIKARVTSKGDMKSWQNDKGAGKLFKIDLLDEEGGEISGAFFKEAADRWYGTIQVGGVYMITGGRVKTADTRYSKGRMYEIMFDDKTQVTPVEDDSRIQAVSFAFLPGLDALTQKAAKEWVDVAGVITRVGEVTDMVAKASGRQLTKREVTMADPSGVTVDLTLWGGQATEFAGQEGTVLAIKGAQVSEWNGRTLSTGQSSVLVTEPAALANPRGRELQQWWMTAGAASVASFANLSANTNRGGGGAGGEGGGMTGPLLDIAQRITVAELKQMGDNSGSGYAAVPLDETKVHVVKATVLHLRFESAGGGGPWYPACENLKDGTRKCNKKCVEDSSSGQSQWSCKDCGPTNMSYRWILSGQIGDHTGSAWVSMYDDQAAQLLGMNANTAAQTYAHYGADSNEYTSLFRAVTWDEAIFTVKNKMESVKEEMRMKTTVIKVRMLDPRPITTYDPATGAQVVTPAPASAPGAAPGSDLVKELQALQKCIANYK